MRKVIARAVESMFSRGENRLIHGHASTILQGVIKRVILAEKLDYLGSTVLGKQDEAFIMERILDALKIDCPLSERDRSMIPASGPLVAVANHPFGGAEAAMLGAILHSVRPDVKMMANHLLGHIDCPEFLETLILVDPFGKSSSPRTNIRPLREAMEWVRGGGALIIFPAGEVSHAHLRGFNIRDPKWNTTVSRIVKKTHAPVLPVYFEGRNSALFYLLGLMHPKFRTLMLPREMFKKTNTRVEAKIGKLISPERMENLSDEECTKYLRLRTYMLRNRKVQEDRVHAIRPGKGSIKLPVQPARSAGLLAKEVHDLAREQVLVSTGKFIVCVARSQEVPNLLNEIGRLREITFRNAGEGTGKSIDLDRYDEYYTHLFLWSLENEELVGAYRLGLTDEILGMHGVRGLYTSTLFHYGYELMERISPAIELGRAFVRPEYQKNFQPLMLLWKGIGRFVSERPRYRHLFGPVSVGNDYLSISRQLILEYSRKNSYRTDLAPLVKAKHPPRISPLQAGRLKSACNLVYDLRDLSELISDIEKDQKGVPILMKQYMKLGGEFLGFSIDPAFSNVLDALILVDLIRTEVKTLDRYMGKSEAGSFLQYHGTVLEKTA